MADSDSDQAGVPLIEDLSDSPEPQKNASAKRKRTTEDDEGAESKKDAKPKKKRPKKPKDIDDEALDSKLGVNHAIGHMDSTLTADHIAQRTRRFDPDISTVEAEDSYISGM
jgi:protein CMS1